MTITNDPSTTSIHRQHDHPLDQEGQGRSQKQSPNRAGIPMLRGARLHTENGSRDHHARTQIGPFASDRKVF